MKKLLIALLIAVTIGCSIKEEQRECNIDYKFRSYFMNCIDLTSVRLVGVYIDSENLWSAYNCLETLTKHRSFVDTASDDANKCEVTFDVANEILAAEGVSWPQFTGPFDPPTIASL